jgi:hypothetical protein
LADYFLEYSFNDSKEIFIFTIYIPRKKVNADELLQYFKTQYGEYNFLRFSGTLIYKFFSNKLPNDTDGLIYEISDEYHKMSFIYF